MSHSDNGNRVAPARERGEIGHRYTGTTAGDKRSQFVDKHLLVESVELRTVQRYQMASAGNIHHHLGS